MAADDGAVEVAERAARRGAAHRLGNRGRDADHEIVRQGDPGLASIFDHLVIIVGLQRVAEGVEPLGDALHHPLEFLRMLGRALDLDAFEQLLEIVGQLFRRSAGVAALRDHIEA